MRIGESIKRFRTLKDMDQKELAKLLNVSNKTISSWETNRTEPKIEMIDKMCEIFHCRRSDFLDSSIAFEITTQDIDKETAILIECYKKASFEEKRLIDNILYKYSESYKQLLEDLKPAANKIEESENWHFDKNGNIIDKGN